jgi:hypothetical protein
MQQTPRWSQIVALTTHPHADIFVMGNMYLATSRASTRGKVMSIQTLPSTTNFKLQYDVTNGQAQTMAQAIANVCENEFTVLTGWFAITTGLGYSLKQRYQLLGVNGIIPITMKRLSHDPE